MTIGIMLIAAAKTPKADCKLISTTIASDVNMTAVLRGDCLHENKHNSKANRPDVADSPT